MHYNVFFVELLGDEELSGMLIPVVIDTKDTLTDSKMIEIAKIFNNYRTVFVKEKRENKLTIRAFSINGEVANCLYSNVATIYSMTSSCYIREVEAGKRNIEIQCQDYLNEVSVSYEDNEVLSIEHVMDKMDFDTGEKKELDGYTEQVVSTKIGDTTVLYTEDPLVYSKIRRTRKGMENPEVDYLLVYWSEVSGIVFFSVKRGPDNKGSKLGSKSQVSMLLSYLVSNGVDKEEVKGLCHVLNSGQYAMIRAKVCDDKLAITMDSRNLVEGILNL